MFSAIRKRLTPSSVRARLTFWYLLTLGVTLAAFAAFTLVIRARSLDRELDRDLEVRVRQAIDDLKPLLLSVDVGLELERDARAARAPILIRDRGRAILFRSPMFPGLSNDGEGAVGRAAHALTRFLSMTDGAGNPIRIATLVLNRPGSGWLTVQMAASTVPVRGAVRQLGFTLVLFIVIVLVVAGYGSNYTARRALAPVDEIVERVQRIQASRPSEQLDVRADSAEIDRLVLMLNEMLYRIGVSVRSARRFAGDVSHELQTPIAAMRGAVDLCLRSGRTIEDYRVMGSDVISEIDRLSALVKDLRLLALAEAGFVEDLEGVDLAALAVECSEIAQALGEDKQIQLETVIEARPRVAGNARQFQRVVLNLAQNAIRYSPVGSGIVIVVGLTDECATLAVRDHGCGIAPEDLPHIFEPFYRADPARARDTGGTGLGLAIADQIVRTHHGRIEVVSEPGAGSTFTVHFPVAMNADADAAVGVPRRQSCAAPRDMAPPTVRPGVTANQKT